MGININMDTANVLSNNILIDNDILLQDVNKSTVLDVPTHADAEELYSSLQGEVMQYVEIIRRDAKTITDIAWELQNVDEEAASDINKTIGE